MAFTAGHADERTTPPLRPLRRVFPYVLRYPVLVVSALISLTVAAGTTLTLPLAVRRMIDHGFSSADTTFVANYFYMLIAIAAILALASACRYYFVITLGERVVADLRRDVFSHVTTLSPAFFDAALSGEIVSRLSADTTQIKSAVGATASLALRNVILGLGAVGMMVLTSPKLSALVIAAIPLVVLPLAAFGRSVRRRSRQAQDTLAGATAYASEQISSVRTLQSFTNEGLVVGRFSRAVESAFDAARASTLARAALTFFAIFAIFTSVVMVLWFGSHDVLTGTMSPGTLGQFLHLFGLCRGRAWRAVGGLGRTLAGSRRCRAVDGNPRRKAGHRSAKRPDAAARHRQRRVVLRQCHLLLSRAARSAGAAQCQLFGEAWRDGRNRRPFRGRQKHRFLAGPALLRSGQREESSSTAWISARPTRQTCAPASPSCRRT